ncbi:MAG: hypothetical protein DIZ80_00370 [endosymbiont of Galathealinum brachiosum]|uniref:Uncharacterized protein n=1 Tax=endosymbiont of Galathealinum brachiosum TaxID=2200906 RepID=A0A370DM22_9GAMM|nr:MAG: hypothetical protein DIZ80_00370 [endosymbiont of Galathealinum brachiosum]
MCDDQFEKSSSKPAKLVEIPLRFHSFDVDDEQGLPTRFNDTQYKVRLIRYTGHLVHLLDNPPVFKPVCCGDDVHPDVFHEQVDNYLWVMGEIISGIFEMNQVGGKEKE